MEDENMEPEMTAAEANGGEAQDEAAAQPEEPISQPEEGQEAEPAPKESESEKKKEKKKKHLTGFFLNVLYILLVLVILLEAAAVCLWLNFDKLLARQEELKPEIPQTAVTSSSYANWYGVYRPADWPAATASQSSLPFPEELENVEDANSQGEP